MSDRFRGLTKGDARATRALGVEPLRKNEVSKPVRIRGSQELHERLAKMSAKEIGQVLERALGLESKT